MSSYTTELRNICQYLVGNKEDESAEVVIAAAAPLIFDFSYPFYDESKRTEFQENFVRHFYMREIGQETYGLWKHQLIDWMKMEMPYYNQLFKSAQLEFDPLEDVHYTRDVAERGTSRASSTQSDNSSTTGSGTSKSNSNSTNIGNTNSTTKYNDTPQDNVQSIANGYLTAAQQVDNGSTNTTSESTNGETSSRSSYNNASTSTGEGSTTGNKIETIKGKYGTKSYAELIEEQRRIIIDVEKQVFEAMNVLFMGIY